MNLYAIMVVYNQSVLDSLSYQSVKKRNDIQFIVVDNSTKDYGNKHIVENDRFTYISMNGNAGLSKAYNAAIDSIHEDGYVILMDDDTNFPDAYYTSIQKYYGQYDILLPVVKYSEGILSPSLFENGVSHPISDFSQLTENMSAINSGMCISLEVFKDYRYDEHLFLDYVDHKFMNDMKHKSKKIMDVEIFQDFSSTTNSKESAKVRFHIFLKDSKYFYLEYLKNKKAYNFVVNKRKARLLLQYKDISFLKG